MINKKNLNPLIKELTNLRLIKNSRLYILNKSTRDKKINVIKDKKTKIIFLEKYLTDFKYYNNLKYNDNVRRIAKTNKTKISKIEIKSKSIKTPIIDDDLRRNNQFKNILKNKHILDFGCGWGGFLRNIQDYKSLTGIELRQECLKFIKKKIKKINVSNNIELLDKKFDIITLFHVLEHIPHQVKTLKMLKSKLKQGGKVIIEVPHAEDFLILQDELPEFKNFTFWSEHLILHTYRSLKTILLKSGFKKVNISYYQRYNFANHLGWFLRKKPGGHEYYDDIISKELNNLYSKNLIKLKQTDTLIAIAQ